MKRKYRKVKYSWAERPGEFCYDWIGRGYHRQIRTFNELRQNLGDAADAELQDLNCRPRGRRSMSNLNSWNDFARSRTGGRSWKDYTRHRKQWMVGEDPKPIELKPVGFVARLIYEIGL